MPIGGAPQGYQRSGGQSCFDKVKVGFMMGCAIGMSTGFLFGGFQAFRYGLRGRELVNTLGLVYLLLFSNLKISNKQFRICFRKIDGPSRRQFWGFYERWNGIKVLKMEFLLFCCNLIFFVI